MRILILSDAHGANFNLIEALEKEREAELVYYLGDGANALTIYSIRTAIKSAL